VPVKASAEATDNDDYRDSHDDFRVARYPPAGISIATAKTSVNAGRHRRTYRQEPGHKGGVGERGKTVPKLKSTVSDHLRERRV
jgi:hypothetical protein